MNAQRLTGPAKWAGVGVLAFGAIVGMVAALMPPRVPVPAHGVAKESVRAPDTREAPPGVEGATPTEPAGSNPSANREPAPAAPLKTTINLNTATQQQLELLPGVGPALASRIIEYRTQHAGFKSIADLDNVKGIGPKILAKLTPLVRVKD